MSDVGPTYKVPLLLTLPLNARKPDGMRQAMPSREDLLNAIGAGHGRLSAAYEVLLAHYYELVAEGARGRYANAIRNTATGRALEAALVEIERLRGNQRPETTGELIERLGWTQPVPEHDPVEGLV